MTDQRGPPDPGDEVKALIVQGRQAVTPDEQLKLFAKAHARDLNDAWAMSWHGMALATVSGRYQEGIVFCEEAVRRVGPNPDLLVNLARAYLAARNKREAVRALRRAMTQARGGDERARIELTALGLRREPVIPFLSRNFFLNKYLGLLRHRLFTKGGRDDGRVPIPAELGQLSGDVGEAQKGLLAKGGADESNR